MTGTGNVECRTMLSAILPKSKSYTALCPWLPMILLIITLPESDDNFFRYLSQVVA